MVQKTYSPKPSDISSTWHVIDAEGQVLGRLATNIAGLLQGKHKPGYARHMLTGDYIIIVNAEKVATTGRKREQKIYYRHTGYMGHLRETPMWKMLEDHPERVIQKAVKGMLPRNSLGSLMLSRLKIYVGPEHPHQAQVLGGERANLRTPQHPLAERRKKHASRAKAPVEEAAVAAVAEVEEATAIEEVAPVEEQRNLNPMLADPNSVAQVDGGEGIGPRGGGDLGRLDHPEATGVALKGREHLDVGTGQAAKSPNVVRHGRAVHLYPIGPSVELSFRGVRGWARGLERSPIH